MALEEIANAIPVSVGKDDESELRREWRINVNTGDLRGVAYRYRGGANGRKVAYYIGKREKPNEFNEIYKEFQEWRGAN